MSDQNRDALTRVIAFANGKGGVGKTSCSVNVAGLAAAAGWKTLFLEFDPQGNAGHDFGYGWEGQSDEGRHMKAALISETPLQPVLTDVRPGLDVIPMGRESLNLIEDVVSGMSRRGEGDFRDLLAARLSPLAVNYDLVIVDTPPTRPTIMQLILGAARWIVVPTRADRSSIEGLRQLAAEISDVRSANPDLEILGAVLFDMDSTAKAVRRNAVEDVSGALSGAAPLFDSAIRHASAAAVQAREEGRLVHELAESAQQAEPWWKALQEGRKPARIPGSAGALADDYLMFANEILTRIAAHEETEARTA